MKRSLSLLLFLFPAVLSLNNCTIKAMNSTHRDAYVAQDQSTVQEKNDADKKSIQAVGLKKLFDLFTAHPNAHRMTYWTHFLRAMHFSLKMGYGSFCLIVHAFFPFLFETVGSDIIKELYADITNQSQQ